MATASRPDETTVVDPQVAGSSKRFPRRTGAPAPKPGPYGRLVEAHGLGGSHRRLLAEVTPGSRVLDVGCATGYVAALLKQQGCVVTGFEYDPAAAAEAVRHCEVIVGDIQSEADRARIPQGFDFVLIGDVLEHLVDPWTVLADMRRLLAPDGRVVISVPNVAAWPVRFSLLGGRFEYADFGLLDKTHLRWFTKATAEELARSAGYEIERLSVVPIERPGGVIRRNVPMPWPLLDDLSVRALPGLFGQQFVLRLVPAAQA